MTEEEKAPRYMTQLLDALGWNQGTRIPLANPDNQVLETSLIDRQNEIQKLKEAIALQNQKTNDLNKYKQHVLSEYQENTRLLFAHKQQLEQEVKLRQLSCNDADSVDRDVIATNKQAKDIAERIDKNQASIAKLLKKADTLKTEVCGERGALQEWRAQIERNSGDIIAVEKFTKQDLSKAKALETKRQKLKVEHDHMLDRLNQLVANLSAEERACERISVQVMEGMEQRRQMMAMWTSAVENLRQRDTDIRHIKEDYEVLEVEANNVADQCREQQTFCDQQAINNAEATRANVNLAQQLSNLRLAFQQLVDLNVTLHSTTLCSQREMQNMHNLLEKLHMENRRIMEQQHRKDLAVKDVVQKIKEIKDKLAESLDKTKSSEQRAKELEAILHEEERYASSLTVNQQRAMHCSFVEQQKLLAMKNEEKLFNMHLKASKAIVSKLDKKQADVLKSLQSLKETLYCICYQAETIGAKVSHMEGAKAEREVSAELLERENRLLEVRGRHAARIALLERHSAKLLEDMRRLARDLEYYVTKHTSQQTRLRTSLLSVEGGEKELRSSRAEWRRMRVEEAMTRLRVAHSTRALAGLDDRAYNADTQRLRLDAAMNERLLEIEARRDMFSMQVRALAEACGKLRGDIKERENRIEQLKKRYDIFIASLGKDDSGQQLSVSFFKVKFAAERAELRERGAALDVDIGRQERDISALEATLRVVHAAHKHFLHRITPLAHDTPEIHELDDLMKQYYETRDAFKDVHGACVALEQRVQDAAARATAAGDKCKQLQQRVSDCENDLDNLRDRISKHEGRLQNALEIIKHNARRAKKIFDNVDDWRIFQLSLWIRDHGESSSNALEALAEQCAGAAPLYSHFSALVSSTDLQRHISRHQRRLQIFVERLQEDSRARGTAVDDGESVFSSSVSTLRSGVSGTSGNTKRLLAFRKTLATKVHEPDLEEDDLVDPGARSSVSLRVVNLGLDDAASSSTGKHDKTLQEDSRARGTAVDDGESVFSSSVSTLRSGVSGTSGNTKRLLAFRKTLATKVHEPDLEEDDLVDPGARSSVSLRVVNLGLDDAASSSTGKHDKTSR